MKRVTLSLLALVLLLASAPASAQTAQSEISRFVDFYGNELERTGFKPDESSTRDTRIAFLQAAVKRFCSPLLAMKRADPGRPISDEVVVWVGTPGYRTFADFLISGGSSAWRLSHHLEGYLPPAQPLVDPLTLGVLSEPTPNGGVPTVPGCRPPTAEPASAPPAPPVVVVPPYPGDPIGNLIGIALFSDYAERGEAPNSGMMIWAWRCAWDMAVNRLPPDVAIAKHRAVWRQALGLPPLP